MDIDYGDYGDYYHDLDDIEESDESDDCDDEVDGLRIIVNEYKISKLYNVADEELEDKLRHVLKCFTVVQIRSLCKRFVIKKVSALKKHELIDAVISWGRNQKGRETRLRMINPAKLSLMANDLGIGVEIPIDVNKIIKDILELMDSRKVY